MNPGATALDPPNVQPILPDGIRAWKDVWSAGHAVGLIHDAPDLATSVFRLEQEVQATSEN